MVSSISIHSNVFPREFCMAGHPVQSHGGPSGWTLQVAMTPNMSSDSKGVREQRIICRWVVRVGYEWSTISKLFALQLHTEDEAHLLTKWKGRAHVVTSDSQAGLSDVRNSLPANRSCWRREEVAVKTSGGSLKLGYTWQVRADTLTPVVLRCTVRLRAVGLVIVRNLLVRVENSIKRFCWRSWREAKVGFVVYQQQQMLKASTTLSYNRTSTNRLLHGRPLVTVQVNILYPRLLDHDILRWTSPRSTPWWCHVMDSEGDPSERSLYQAHSTLKRHVS